MSQSLSNEQQFFADIARILQTGRSQAYQAVNTAMVQTYWQLGQRIVEQEQQGEVRAEYGKALITNLSRYLGDTFGKGFSVANLKNFRQFYLTYPDFDELATHCVANLSWSHVRLIMRLENPAERSYYLQEASSQNWSTRLLERNIKSGYYRRVLNHDISAEKQFATSPEAFIKDPYVLEFLNLPSDLSGKENLLEQSLINQLQKFLLELGKGFSFVARQMRISTETSHFYVDLVFYNYLLKCFVVIDLKTEKLTHQDIGQMDMYVRMFDDLKRGEDDNPTLGIILCADKDETLVHYSVLSESKQLFASKYQTMLPTEEELAAMLEQDLQRSLGDKNE
ncbi:PDDEXK nuclease domain-containing protein [Paenalcaligenes faecalis]|uniref:PDDEXK nuclease domain-containing protein n=1 Tax=Paenalcaligenes faecalis TaxID=2980099 RepID=UPI0022B940AC|nr:PDDEXK nuclease domain-containing protein [Paenalcaligenes faecalis]